MSKYNKIVLNIPHSSILSYDKGWEGRCCMFSVVKKWTDWHTNILFSSNNKNVIPVIYEYSRFYCDVERLIDDPLESNGNGIVYTEYEGFKRNVDDKLRLECMDSYYNYIRKLKREITKDSIVIDCHSFPADLSDTDICIGFNEDESKPPQKVIDDIAEIFRSKGLKVSFNTPFSNSLTPEKEFDYHSIMIEVNKKLYMSEITLLPYITTLHNLNKVINEVYEYLLNK